MVCVCGLFPLPSLLLQSRLCVQLCLLGMFKRGSGGSRLKSSTKHVEQTQIHISASLWCRAGVAASNPATVGTIVPPVHSICESRRASRAQESSNKLKSQLKLGDLVKRSHSKCYCRATAPVNLSTAEETRFLAASRYTAPSHSRPVQCTT